MPMSFPQLLRGAIGEGAKSLGGRFLNSMSASTMLPITRSGIYLANDVYPGLGLLPDISELFRLYATNQIDEAYLKELLRYHGVTSHPNLWAKVVNNSLNWPSEDLIIRARRRGLIEGDTFQKLAQQLGYKDPDAWHLVFNQPFPWSADDVWRVARAYDWEPEKREKFLRAAGITLEDDRGMMILNHPVPSPAETLALSNRKAITDKQRDEWLILAGLTDTEVRGAYKEFQSQIPSSSNLIEFAVKEVWNGPIVAKLGYDDEFDQIPAYKEWMQRAGFGGDPKLPGLGENQPESWAQAFWRAHWRNISPSQAYTMLHRLRPTGGIDGGPRVPALQTMVNGQPISKPLSPVTLEEVEAVLKVSDYPPVWRDRMAAISYLPMRLVDIRRTVYFSLQDDAFRQQVMPQTWSVHKWASEQFQDRGHSKETADQLSALTYKTAQVSVKRDDERFWSRANKGPTAVVLQRYMVGLVTRDNARVELINLQHEVADANKMLDLIDVKKITSDVKQEIRWLEKNLLRGAASIEMARKILEGIGIVPSEVERYVTKWKFMLDESAIVAATDEAIDLLKRELITWDVCMFRLVNLGWENAEEIINAALTEAQGI